MGVINNEILFTNYSLYINVLFCVGCGSNAIIKTRSVADSKDNISNIANVETRYQRGLNGYIGKADVQKVPYATKIWRSTSLSMYRRMLTINSTSEMMWYMILDTHPPGRHVELQSLTIQVGFVSIPLLMCMRYT